MFSTSEHCLSIQYAVCTINIAIHAKLYMLSAFLCIVSFYNKNVHAFDHNYGRIQLKGSMFIYVRFAGLHINRRKYASYCSQWNAVRVVRKQADCKLGISILKTPCASTIFGAVGQPLTLHSITSIFAWWHVNVIVRGSTYLNIYYRDNFRQKFPETKLTN